MSEHPRSVVLREIVDELTLPELLKKVIQLEVMNERAKNELALIHDFNLIGGFKMLDLESKSRVEVDDFLRAI